MSTRPTQLEVVKQRLVTLLASAAGLLPDEQLRDMRELAEAGEPGIALENFVDQLYEYDVSVSVALATEAAALANMMGLRVYPALKVTQ